MRYIGSKVSLINEIRTAVEKQAPNSLVFCDIFAGTGVVGREFKTSHQIISNDILYFSFVLNAAYNGLKQAPTFSRLMKELKQDPIQYFNELQFKEIDISPDDFVTISYSPAGDDGRQYLSVENALRIDRVRQTIAVWLAEGLISEDEFFYLLASLIEEVPSISNTTGTYGAYLKHWDKRSLKRLHMNHLKIVPSKKNNRVFNKDANTLIKEISGDVLYLDTPYNGRQYSSNYHLLESLARYDKPSLKGVTGTRSDRAGESLYCRKRSVYESFDFLLGNANFHTFVISYSSDGLLKEDQLIELVFKHGDAKSMNFTKIPYRRYKRTINDERNVIEYLISINK
jgi:adenine-specific DNA-methyltransferase